MKLKKTKKIRPCHLNQVSHGTCICMYVNADTLMTRFLLHNFKNQTYISYSLSVSHPFPKEKFWVHTCLYWFHFNVLT
jgi:hypothetical protein